LFLLSLCAWLAACGGGSGSPQAVTFYEDVAPILDAQCVGCHRAGGIAPFLLTDYGWPRRTPRPLSRRPPRA
jgi:hypothetical protein